MLVDVCATSFLLLLIPLFLLELLVLLSQTVRLLAVSYMWECEIIFARGYLRAFLCMHACVCAHAPKF